LAFSPSTVAPSTVSVLEKSRAISVIGAVARMVSVAVPVSCFFVGDQVSLRS
jgi:hypothetical protein